MSGVNVALLVETVYYKLLGEVEGDTDYIQSMIPYLDEGVARVQIRNLRLDLIRITPKPNLITNLSYQNTIMSLQTNKNTQH